MNMPNSSSKEVDRRYGGGRKPIEQDECKNKNFSLKFELNFNFLKLKKKIS